MLDGISTDLNDDLADPNFSPAKPLCSRFFASIAAPDVDAMSVKELKALIEANGLQFGDCVEKSDLQVRAREAQNKKEQVAWEGAQPEGNPIAQQQAASAPDNKHIPVVGAVAEDICEPIMWFCVSRATGRVHLYSTDKQLLGLNLAAVETTLCQEDPDVLAQLGGDHQLVNEVAQFGREWQQLRGCDKKQLMMKLVQVPLKAAIKQKRKPTAKAKKRKRVAQPDKVCAQCGCTIAGDGGPALNQEVCESCAIDRGDPNSPNNVVGSKGEAFSYIAQHSPPPTLSDLMNQDNPLESTSAPSPTISAQCEVIDLDSSEDACRAWPMQDVIVLE